MSLLRAEKDQGCLTLADERMTHFWITREEAVRFVIRSIACMRGGEVFVPKMPTTSLLDLAPSPPTAVSRWPAFVPVRNSTRS